MLAPNLRILRPRYKRNARLVDQDGIRLVDHSEGKWTLDDFVCAPGETITQIIEAYLIRSGIGDITEISGAASLTGHVLLYVSDRQPEPAVNLSHPFGIPAGEIVVRGQYMHAPALEGVPAHGGDGSQSFALTRLHFSNVPALQRKRSQELHVKQTQPEHTLCDDRRQRECFRHVRIACHPSCSGFKLIIGKPGQLLTPTRNGRQFGLRLIVNEAKKAH